MRAPPKGPKGARRGQRNSGGDVTVVTEPLSEPQASGSEPPASNPVKARVLAPTQGCAAAALPCKVPRIPSPPVGVEPATEPGGEPLIDMDEEPATASRSNNRAFREQVDGRP